MAEYLNNFHEYLSKKLRGELPGKNAQLKMVPEARRQEISRFSKQADARKAAVLICFYLDNDKKIKLVLIRRNEYDGVHSGQISFPGGKKESEDRSMVDTALREAEEEVGVPRDSVEVIGSISTVYIPPSNFLVTPVVGWLKDIPQFKPQESEVTEILTISLEDLRDKNNIQTMDIPHPEFKIINVPCYYIEGHIIWGATAMMLSEVMEMLES